MLGSAHIFPPRRVASPRALAAAALAAALLLAAAATDSAAAGDSCGAVGKVPGAQTTADLRRETICLVNRVRANHGLGALEANRKLRKAAQRHSSAMVRHDFFSHSGGGGIQRRIARAGYLAGASHFNVGEVIGAGILNLGSPRATVRGWMRTSSHRKEILTAGFRDIGVGVTRGVPGGGSRGATYTADFGWRD